MYFNFSCDELALLEQAVDDKIESLRLESKHLLSEDEEDGFNFSDYEKLFEKFKSSETAWSAKDIEKKILALMSEVVDVEYENPVGYDRDYIDGFHDALVDVLNSFGIQHNFSI